MMNWMMFLLSVDFLKGHTRSFNKNKNVIFISKEMLCLSQAMKFNNEIVKLSSFNSCNMKKY